MTEPTGRETGYALWDWPVRLIHWAIVLILPASWWTAEEGYFTVHQWLGLTVLVLVLTRICWGFLGSPQARFRDFLRGPRAVLAYFRGEPSTTPGHNPAGGWSVMVLWSLLLMQALTGTVSSDDVMFEGPFYYVFDSGIADALAEIHEVLFKGILAFVALHVGTVIWYERRRDQRLLKPMILGRSAGREGTGPAQPLYKAIVIALLLAGLLWGLMELAPEPPPAFYW
mgnify:CR=1 FL=1